MAHLGLLLWSLDFLERLWHGAHRRSFQWLLLGISLAWVGQQMVTGRFAIEEANRYKDAWLRFVAGDWTPDMLRYVYMSIQIVNAPSRARLFAHEWTLEDNKLMPIGTEKA